MRRDAGQRERDPPAARQRGQRRAAAREHHRDPPARARRDPERVDRAAGRAPQERDDATRPVREPARAREKGRASGAVPRDDRAAQRGEGARNAAQPDRPRARPEHDRAPTRRAPAATTARSAYSSAPRAPPDPIPHPRSSRCRTTAVTWGARSSGNARAPITATIRWLAMSIPPEDECAPVSAPPASPLAGCLRGPPQRRAGLTTMCRRRVRIEATRAAGIHARR